MKTFVIGLLLGSVLTALAMQWLPEPVVSQITERVDSPPPRIVASTEAPTPIAKVEKSQAAPSANVSAPSPATASTNTEADQSTSPDLSAFDDPPEVVERLANVTDRTRIEELSEVQREDICWRWRRQKVAREHAAKQAEIKDVAWAYPMEQLIRQHVRGKLGQQQQEFSVDCRTTFCTLRTTVYSLEAGERFRKAVEGIHGAPWNDFMGGESGGSSIDGGQTSELHFEFRRPTPEQRQMLEQARANGWVIE